VGYRLTFGNKPTHLQGCSQQAPLFSSLFLLGVQQTVPFDGFEQQDDSVLPGCDFVSLLF